MKKILRVLLPVTVAVLILGLSLAAYAKDGSAGGDQKKDAKTNASDVQSGKHQTMCPFCPTMAVNKSVYVDYKGKRIYFCGQGCAEHFKKDPEKYMKQLADMGILLDDVPAAPAQKTDKAAAPEVKKDQPQTTCPVMGGAINKSVYTDYKGKRVYFCCPMCIDTFKKDPEKYMKKMADEGVKLEDAPKAK